MVDFRRRLMEAARARGEPVAAMGPALGFRELKWMKPVYVDDTIEYHERNHRGEESRKAVLALALVSIPPPRDQPAWRSP